MPEIYSIFHLPQLSFSQFDITRFPALCKRVNLVAPGIYQLEFPLKC